MRIAALMRSSRPIATLADDRPKIRPNSRPKNPAAPRPKNPAAPRPKTKPATSTSGPGMNKVPMSGGCLLRNTLCGVTGLVATERWVLRGGVFLMPLVYSWGTYDHFILPKLLLARVLVIGLLILFIVRTALSGRL